MRSGAPSLAISEGGFYPTRTGVTIRNQHVIGRIIRDINALPVMPRGIFVCPNDVGVSYRLVFRYPDGSSRAVVADPSGCRMVTSRGERARWAEGTDHSALFSDLERLAG